MTSQQQLASSAGADPALDYGPDYYKHGCGPIPYERNSHWLNFFSGIAAELVRSLRPKRVFDAGCAWGFLVEAFWDLGVEAYGSDISSYAIANVRRDMQPYCYVASLTEPIHGTYDLVTCIEVLEHMPEQEAKEAVRQMAQVTDAILFSSTPNDFDEPTHVNVHPPIYWLKLFSGHQFVPDLLYDASFLSPQAYLLRRQPEPLPPDVLILFSETVRNRIYKAAFVTRQTRIEELERERTALEQRVTELEACTADARQELAQQNAELRSQVELGKQSAELAVELRRNVEDWKSKAIKSEAALTAWAAHNTELTQRVDDLRTELQTVYTSPAWVLIRRYREWFQSMYWRHKWFRTSFEPAVQWALTRMNVSGGKPFGAAPFSDVPAAVTAPGRLETTPGAIASGREQHDAAPERNNYQSWILQNEPTESQLEIQRRMRALFSYRPTISVLVPIFKVPQAVMHEMIQSVIDQTYDNWELCLAHADPDNPEQREYLTSLAEKDARVKVKLLSTNKGISENSNEALTLVSGEFLALLDHDDTLAPFALFEVVQLLNEDRTANFIYSDKDEIAENSNERIRPLFKPQWSPEILLNTNYLTHLCVMRTAHVLESGGWRKKTDGAQDWDLFARITSRHGNVRHIAKVLYHWRRIATSVASGGIEVKPYAAQGQVRAVEDFCREQDLPAKVAFIGGIGIRVSWPPQPDCKVSVIFLGSHPGPQTVTAAEGLLSQTDFPDVEILVPSCEKKAGAGAVKVVQVRENATLIERIERAVRESSGRILAFIDEAVKPDGADWLTELVGPLANPAIGMTGSKAVDANTRHIRHCGLVFTVEGKIEYIYAGEPEHVNEEFGSAGWYRNWSAVSGACFAMRREVWIENDGLSGTISHPRLDVHLCLKVGQAGKRIVYNPFARVYQSRPAALEETLSPENKQTAEYIKSCFPFGDPYFNPNLNCRNGKLHFNRSGRSSGTSSRGTDYAAESQVIVQSYDFSREQVERSKVICTTAGTGRMDRITWFLPDFVNPFYGGVHTILRFADSFRRAHDVQSMLCMIAHGPASRFRQQIAAAFPDLAANCEIAVIDGDSRVHELPACDAAIATLWTTAYAALKFQKARRKFYFIQDDEALFYPAGSTSALVEATYRFGFKGICNTVSLLERYQERGGEGEYFSPCIDPSIFNAFGRKPLDGRRPFTVFCYGRPGHPRNCFELLSAALRILKEHLRDEILIVNAGAPWDLSAYGLEGVVENLGMLGYHSTGALYRMCDAGVVMMMTRHPSYLPMELMACGSLVITNRNPDTAWLLHDGENCLLAEGSVSSFVERVEEALRNAGLRATITNNARAMVEQHYSDWRKESDKVYNYMLSQC